jgi:hypothetical protein
VTPDERWTALKTFLADERRAHDEIAVSCAGSRDLAATRWEQRGIVQGLDRALFKMDGLEAAR